MNCNIWRVAYISILLGICELSKRKLEVGSSNSVQDFGLLQKEDSWTLNFSFGDKLI